MITAASIGLMIILCLLQAKESITATTWEKNVQGSVVLKLNKEAAAQASHNGRAIIKALGFVELETVTDDLTKLKIKKLATTKKTPQAIKKLAIRDMITSINGTPVKLTKQGGIDAYLKSLDGLDLAKGVSIGFLHPVNYDNTVKAVVFGGGLIVFGLIAFWLMNKQKSVDYMIATEAEMRKVNWPPVKEVVGSTKIVIVGTFMLVGLLYLSDIIFSGLFSWMI